MWKNDLPESMLFLEYLTLLLSKKILSYFISHHKRINFAAL
jgi:hypothetical protein